MSVVDGILRSLIGEEAAQKILDHPELHVLKLPAHMVDDLIEGTVMIVPVGVLCDLCDLPAANKFCQCETETITDDEGFSTTIKHRKGEHEDRAAQIRKAVTRGPVVPPSGEWAGDRPILSPAFDGRYTPGFGGDVLGGDGTERADVEVVSETPVWGRGVDADPQGDTSVGVGDSTPAPTYTPEPTPVSEPQPASSDYGSSDSGFSGGGGGGDSW